MTSPERKSQNSNMLLAFLTLVGVIALVALVGFLTLKKGPEIIQGQAETTEYRVSSKVPGRILCLLVKEGDKVKKGDTLAILEAPDVEAKMAQAKAAEAMAQAQNEKALNTTDKRGSQYVKNTVKEIKQILNIKNIDKYFEKLFN